MAVTIQVRRDTAANWTAANPTLAAGELGFETNTGKLKIGDGSTAWNSLAYLSPGGGATGAAGGVLSGTYPNPGFASDMATQAELDAHTGDTTDAHDASAISFSPTGSVAATDVQAAIAEVVAEGGGGIPQGGPLSADLAAGGFSITDLVAPTNAQDVATKGYVDAAGGGAGTPIDGWVDDTADTWTYASATTFTVTGNKTASLTVGTRLKFTQTTVKYFVVVASSHAAGTTTVTVTGGSDYSIANAAISANYHSYVANPQGYPDWFNFTTSVTGFSSTTDNVGRFKVVGRACTIAVRISGTSNATTFNFTLPIACAAANLLPWTAPVVGQDNTVTGSRRYVFSTSTNCRADVAINTSNGWTASGTKSLNFVTTYEI